MTRKNKIERNDWEEGVYGKKQEFNIEVWKRIRELIIERDGHKCQSCFKKKRGT